MTLKSTTPGLLWYHNLRAWRSVSGVKYCHLSVSFYSFPPFCQVPKSAWPILSLPECVHSDQIMLFLYAQLSRQAENTWSHRSVQTDPLLRPEICKADVENTQASVFSQTAQSLTLFDFRLVAALLLMDLDLTSDIQRTGTLPSKKSKCVNNRPLGHPFPSFLNYQQGHCPVSHIARFALATQFSIICFWH